MLSAIGNWVGLIGGLLSLVFIARLLSPMDFGVFGMALVTFSIPEILTSGSLGESLIQRKNLKPGHVNSVFIQSLLLAFVFWLIVVLSAPLIARGFNQPELVPILRVFSVVLLIGALTSVPAALLQRDLRFSEITMVDVVGTIVAAVVGVTLAYFLRNVWALVGMEMSRRTVRLVAFAYLAKWRPSFESSWTATRELTRFNSANMISKFVQAVDGAVPRVFIGSMLGPAALGMFNISVRLLMQVNGAVVSPFAAVALPVASQTQNDLPMLHRAIEGAMRLAALIAYPTFIGACVIAPVAVPIVFGEQWIPAVPIIQVVLLMGLRSPTTAFNAGVLMGVGRPDYILKIAIVSLVASTILVLATIRYGLYAVVIALLVQQLMTWMLGALAVKSAIGFPMHRQVIAGSTAFIAALVMGLIVWLSMRMLPDAWTGPIEMLVLVPIGVVSYLAALACLSPRLAHRVVQALIILVQGRPEEALAVARGTS
ncbi:MAG: lipopolysaccharide biosynthesis protein [Hyphomonas sp.]